MSTFLNKELLLNGVKWQTTLTLVRQLVSFLAILVVIRTFDRDQYGNYQFVFTMISFFGLSALSGMKTVVNQSVARGHDGTYNDATSMSFCGACLGAISLAIYSGYLWTHGNFELAQVFILAAVLFPSAYGLTNWQPFLLAKHRYRTFALIQSFSAIAAQLFLVACVLLRPDTILFASLTALCVSSIQNIYMHRKCQASTENEKLSEEGSMAYGLRVSFYDMFNVLGNISERFIIFSSMSPSALAGYAVASRLPELTKDYLQSLRSVIIPQLAQQKTLTKSLNRYINKCAAAFFLLAASISFFIVPWIVPTLFTDVYTDVVIYCQVLFLSVGVSAYSTLKFGFILSRLDDKSVRNIHIVSNIVRVSCALILIPLYGISGAVASVVIYRLATILIVNYQISKFHLKDNDLLKSKADCR
jgi:O-antigen/teichoic acid export membrane protein